MRPVRSFSFYLLLAALPGLPLLGLLARLLPEAARPQCLAHLTTGYPCPGCGTFRALSLLTAGRFVRAFLTQPLMTMLFAGILLASATAWTLWLLKRPAPRLPAIPPAAWKWLMAGLVVALLVNWIYLVEASV